MGASATSHIASTPCPRWPLSRRPAPKGKSDGLFHIPQSGHQAFYGDAAPIANQAFNYAEEVAWAH